MPDSIGFAPIQKPGNTVIQICRGPYRGPHDDDGITAVYQLHLYSQLWSS